MNAVLIDLSRDYLASLTTQELRLIVLTCDLPTTKARAYQELKWRGKLG